MLKTLDGEFTLLQLDAHDFERIVSRHAGVQIIVTLELEGSAYMALLREIQRDGITGRITHADFGQIDTQSEINVEIQIVLVGEPEGVRTQNGVLEQHLRHVEVECLPQDVVESFTFDVTDLKVGDDVTVADLKLDAKFTVHTRPDAVVATVSEVREEAEPAQTDGEAPAQPELSVKKGKAEEEGAAAAAAPAAKAKGK